MSFSKLEVMPGVWQIQDAMGVCMTLLAGSEEALLVDTGYGLEDVGAYVRSLTDKPLRVILTHGHHDHALGARWFRQVELLAEDFPVYETYTGRAWRENVLNQAEQKGILTDRAEYVLAAMPRPAALKDSVIPLGGLTVHLIPCPGHTPGSLVLYAEEIRLLLTGDNWNPCTWLFFPEALGAKAYRKNVRELLKIPFAYALCSHQFQRFDRSMPESFWLGLEDAALDGAIPVSAGERVGVKTVQADLPRGQIFVFDPDKYFTQKERSGQA